MEQQVDIELWNEFEQEVSKIETFDISKLELTEEDNKVLDIFFKKFLNPAEIFPAGDRHTTLEKNFAIYIVKNKIPIEQIKEAYASKGFKISSLLSQIKGVIKGTYGVKPHISIGELVNWCKKFRPDLVSLFIEASPVTKKNFNLLWDNELQNYQEKNVDWRVSRFVKSQSINIVGGKRSTLKTWLAMNMGYCVVMGKPFLNKFPCVKGRVLYFDRENGFAELKKRSLMEKKGLDITEEAEMAFLSETTLKLDNHLDLFQITEFIKQNNIVLVIVDTYRRVISFKEDNADEVSQFFIDMIKPLCEQTGVSFIFIHHERKGESQGDDMDMLRGSSDLANLVDGVIQIERKGEYLTIKQTKQRGSKELEPFQIKIDTDEVNHFRFEYVGEKQSIELATCDLIITWILETAKKEFTYTEVMTYCNNLGYKKNAVVDALSNLKAKGLLEKKSLKSPYVVTKLLNQEVLV